MGSYGTLTEAFPIEIGRKAESIRSDQKCHTQLVQKVHLRKRRAGAGGC